MTRNTSNSKATAPSMLLSPTRSSRRLKGSSSPETSLDTPLHSENKPNGGKRQYRKKANKNASVQETENTSGSSESSDRSSDTEEGDENDSGEADDADADVDETDGDAPFGRSLRGLGRGKGKGPVKSKKPAIVVQETSDIENSQPSDTFQDHEAGLRGGLRSRKRTFSNVSNASRLSVLVNDEDREEVRDDGSHYPRKKQSRRLSHNNGLLTYEASKEERKNNQSAIEDDSENADFLDDDDDYSGVNAISDSEDDEVDVEAEEERMLIAQAEAGGDFSEFFRTADIQNGELFPMSDNQLMSSGVFEDIFNNNGDLDNTIVFGENNEDSPSPRSRRSGNRVRFTDDAPSMSGSTTVTSSSEDDMFPDLFVQQETLDSTFRRMIENGEDEHDDIAGRSDDEGSFWDLRGSDDMEMEDIEDLEEPEDDESSVGSSSGYESMLTRFIGCLSLLIHIFSRRRRDYR
jgi:hypothetical protein